ncbi:MAG: thermonuclease family protein [Erythrobacter sp.]|uniref:thermonuclease family protein n=1 Tax=Erythrobacter sp. TaxID=1042 RepID=UPI0025FEB97F|nr:thermonuclease family protein [Erythrobacter sp.]MCM0001144.1 thermonuclease family protein [Erythrobacter sp.]
MRKPLLLFVAALAVLASSPAAANVLAGPAEVIDGDTIDMTGTRIRLIGIDAPESAQQCRRDGAAWDCGRDAAAALHEILAGGPLECTALGTDRYGRTLATCRTALFDLGHEMVRRGFAVPFGDDAPADYAEARDFARQLQFGIWAGEFEEPAAWRAANPQAAPLLARAAADEVPARTAPQRPAREARYTNAFGCAIKGNHSRYGSYIYHLPGQKYYDATRPEALFCTEREAIAAGFRRSKE